MRKGMSGAFWTESYTAEGQFVGQKWVPTELEESQGAPRPEQLLSAMLELHPEAAASVPEWIQQQLPKDPPAAEVAAAELEKLKTWLLEHRELRKVETFATAMRVVAGVCPLVVVIAADIAIVKAVCNLK